MITDVIQLISFLSDIVTIAVGGITIFLFITQKENISNIIKKMSNRSSSKTIANLKSIVAKLPGKTKEENTVLLSEIYGRLNGNEQIKAKCLVLITQIADKKSGKTSISNNWIIEMKSLLEEKINEIEIDFI